MYSPGEVIANRWTVDFASSRLSAAAFAQVSAVFHFDENIQGFEHRLGAFPATPHVIARKPGAAAYAQICVAVATADFCIGKPSES
jgi:hypothetical protein